MAERVFGEIPGVPEGSMIESRLELSRAGVHRPNQAGISGSATDGADSIVLSGGYEDDLDEDDLIVYTGHGGRDPETGQQVSDQLLTGGNLALAVSCLQGLPVRVVRKVAHPWRSSQGSAYRYDGLYRVDTYWRDTGISGHTIWRFRLTKLNADSSSATQIGETQASYLSAPRQPTTTLRIIRDTPQARRIKTLYNYHCQVCDTRLAGSAGPYAEAAHIRPLGIPHNGPDTLDNLLCLCPNHHVLFDFGGFAIARDLSLIGLDGSLFRTAQHRINSDFLQYHRRHFFKGI